MPISRSEFERGEISPGHLIIEFLCANPEQAYSLGELWREFGSSVALSIDEFQGILLDLERDVHIESKLIKGMLYYICGKRLGFSDR